MKIINSRITAKLALTLMIVLTLCAFCSKTSLANDSSLGDLNGDADAFFLMETDWDDDGEPVSFDVGLVSEDISVTAYNDIFSYDLRYLLEITASASGTGLPFGLIPIDGFMVRTTQESGSIPLVISGDLGDKIWQREADEEIGSLSLNSDWTEVIWNFSENNPDNSRLIVGTMYLNNSEIDTAPISSDCGIAVVKLEDIPYYFEVWGVDDPESDEDAEPVFLGTLSSDQEYFDVLSLDLGSVVVESEDYGWLAIANLGTKNIQLENSLLNSSIRPSSEVYYHSSYTANVADDPAELSDVNATSLAPNLAPGITSLLKTKNKVTEIKDEVITIPVEMYLDTIMNESVVQTEDGRIEIHFSPAQKTGEGSYETFEGELGITENITSGDVSGITVNSVVSSKDLGSMAPDSFKVEQGNGRSIASFSVDTGSGDFGTSDAIPMVLNMNLILEDNFDTYKGSTANEARSFLQEHSVFVKTWQDGTTTEIPLDSDAVSMRIQQTDEGTHAMVTLNALVVNGGDMGETVEVTVKGRPYLAIYDGTDNDSISDPITFESSEGEDGPSSSGGDSSGCSLMPFPAALLFLLPLVLLKK